ncbi:MAG: hypothetical protein H5T86_03110 [Armatimonadetes bacterium]|nr:hypothetical protein [Armatimonadota bacterium]
MNEDLEKLLTQFEQGSECTFHVRDVSGEELTWFSAGLSENLGTVIEELVTEAGLPEGVYALYGVSDEGEVVRLDPSVSVGEALDRAGISEREGVKVLLGPELQGN